MNLQGLRNKNSSQGSRNIAVAGDFRRHAGPRHYAVCLFLLALSWLTAPVGCSPPTGTADDKKTAAATAPAVGESKLNRLSRESSPYLLLHARNPVDWYPWGPEALEKARTEGKLIFISIGYSSCHWCHVMEQKVFSDVEIAKYMNDHFVNIKIDREERPELDEIYMTALTLYFQAIGANQGGGWPLSLFLTPEGKPLGGGTYFPPRDEDGRLGFSTFMARVVDSWKNKHDEMAKNADYLATAVQRALTHRPALRKTNLDAKLLAGVTDRLTASFDPQYGGFGFDPNDSQRPKFPVPAKLALLQYEAVHRGQDAAGKMLYLTLGQMAAGGIYDHVGGGFHRYSTDRSWTIPHFEKMLYDNAQLAEIYAEAFHHTGDVRYRQVAEETIEFVQRELGDPAGGFYSSIDADTDGVEGRYYIWTRPDLAAALSPEEAQLLAAVYGTEGQPNFEQGYVLAIVRPLSEVAVDWKLTPAQLQAHLQRIRSKLLTARQKRQPPLRDDKILVSWNGLMIRSLARSGKFLKRKDYVEAAAQCALFIVENMRDSQGRLLHSYRDKQAKIPGYLDDYAFLTEGLLALYDAGGDERWANAARRLTDMQLSLFWDERGGGCFYTAKDHEQLLARPKTAFDSVLPSGNSTTIRNLLRLAVTTGDPGYRQKAEQSLKLFAPLLEEAPDNVTNVALAVHEYLEGTAGKTAPDSGAAADGAPLATPGKKPLIQDPNVGPGGFDASASPPERESPPLRGGPAPKSKVPERVAANVFFSANMLPPGGSVRALVHLKIEEGWHIMANPTGNEFYEPTTLEVRSKLGVEAKQIRFAKGRDYLVGDDALKVFEGQTSVLVELRVPAEAAGQEDELVLAITYTSCHETKGCEAKSKTLVLKIPMRVAQTLDEVKPINSQLFAPRTKPAAPAVE